MTKSPMKEIPPHTIPNTRLQLYAGYIIDDLRFRAYVPTTIFYPQVAELRAYKMHNPRNQLPKHREEIVKIKYVKLKSLPKWNVEYQCLELSKRDEKHFKQALSKLEKELI